MDDEEPEEDVVSGISGLLLRSLGSACRESRDIVTRAYPESLRVWEYGGPRFIARRSPRRSRQVRCNPATDILVIASMPDYSSLHPTEDGPDQRLGTNFRDARIARQFLRRPEEFRHFRKVISSFQRVALDYVGIRADDLDFDSDGENDYRDIQTDLEEVIRTPDTAMLLFWFESLRQLSLWPNPRWWPEVSGDRIWVDDVRMLSMDYESLGDDIDLLNDYRRYARIQHHHAAADEGLHWIARPKPLPSSKMGCYVPSAWLKE
ncbi:hypothetical protein PG991_004489 [Apiospora marii]|uniref:Uncharacterized protein n=2 Tax=Apiospora marii TaxID=335849 RepID=A0ABR1S7W6_9PEZI